MTKYRFLVDCVDKKSCKIVRKDMEQMGFKVSDTSLSWGGDHSGTKQFTSRKQAESVARQILEKHEDKMYQIIVD